MSRSRQSAVLLLGPTGCGKTPLGERIAQRGLRGRRCVHFDFGANLRQVVTCGSADESLSEQDIDYLRGVLKNNALLTDEDFPIAHRVLTAFLRRHRVDRETIVVLNGLPRHVGQARALDPIFDVGQVIRLHCSPAVVHARIAANAGGDRTDRVDDEASDVDRKLAIYACQTEPLVEYYRARGAVITDITVATSTSADDLYAAL